MMPVRYRLSALQQSGALHGIAHLLPGIPIGDWICCERSEEAECPSAGAALLCVVHDELQTGAAADVEGFVCQIVNADVRVARSLGIARLAAHAVKAPLFPKRGAAAIELPSMRRSCARFRSDLGRLRRVTCQDFRQQDVELLALVLIEAREQVILNGSGPLLQVPKMQTYRFDQRDRGILVGRGSSRQCRAAS